MLVVVEWVGWVVGAAGALLSGLSGVFILRAQRGQPISYKNWSPVAPKWLIVLWYLGQGVLVIAAVLLFDALGWWSLAYLAMMLVVPTVTAIETHNRLLPHGARLRDDERTSLL